MSRSPHISSASLRAAAFDIPFGSHDGEVESLGDALHRAAEEILLLDERQGAETTVPRVLTVADIVRVAERAGIAPSLRRDRSDE